VLAYVGVFVAAFAAATILPFSSELMVAGAAQTEGVRLGVLWGVATAGNTLGGVVNWGLGRFALRFQSHRWFPVGPASLARAQAWFQRWGVWTLALAWAPVVGDPLTLVAGMMRVPLALFVVLVGLGKAARYALVLWAAG
jgi:membrane protein YqaA with SNARE-associated domain